jgi:Domain of unknown function (DUF6933)
MAVIHCTQKFLKDLGNPPLAGMEDADTGDLTSWYANLLRINRRKCVMFTNEKTLYSFLVPNMVKEHFKEFRVVFLTHLCLNLRYEGFGPDVIKMVREEHQEIRFAKTASRSVLGSMNDFADQYECYIKIAGGTDNADIMVISRKVNETPMSLLKYESPIRTLKSLIVPVGGI